VVARGPLAREVGPRLVPGHAVYVEGRLESRMIESQGARRPQLEVDALVIECLEEAPGAGGETERPPGAAPAEGEG
jgi:single-stranded DNA-binding protein